MPISKLISESIPKGSWPAGGEVNLDYKKKDTRFSGKYAKTEKVSQMGPQGSQLFNIPINKLISESVPKGSWPGGGEVNLDYKKKKQMPKIGSLVSSSVQTGVIDKYNKLLREAMVDFYIVTYDKNDYN